MAMISPALKSRVDRIEEKVNRPEHTLAIAAK